MFPGENYYPETRHASLRCCVSGDVRWRAKPPATGAKRTCAATIISRGLERSDKNTGTLLRNENMSLRKVYGGTPIGNESRCDTCTHARIIQGYAESERIVFCTGMYDPIRIPFKVMQCTDYEDRRLPDFDNMKEIAWQIRSKSAGSVAGFVTMPEDADSQDQQSEAKPEEVPAASEKE